ncbi:MAG: peptidoglycan DD-metalloendopeptidase family protein [Bacteroidota bacterium]
MKTSLFKSGGLLACLAILVWIGMKYQTGTPTASIYKATQNLLETPTCLYGVEVDTLQVLSAAFEQNENLGEVLAAYNVSAQRVAELASIPREIFDVRRLRADRPYTILYQADSLHTAQSFIYHPNPIEYVRIDFGDSLHVEWGKNSVDTVAHELTGVIESSLYQSVVEQGGSPQLVNELSDVYAWVIDFFGLQKGDQYKIIYTTHAVKGKEAGFGHIQAASFVHQGKELLAYAFDQGKGREYFDECGQSLRKTFLKAPLRYSRISSHFSYSRLHPILKIRRPHLGVDYAAPMGTPVLAVGDGTVIGVSYSGGAGRMVKIQHNSNYVTAYLHLSGYGPGVKVGATVTQGQVIGYVGSSGLSTGPHLDFRFYKNGVPVDPLKIDPGSAEPVAKAYEEAYFEYIKNWQGRLADLRVKTHPREIES